MPLTPTMLSDASITNGLKFLVYGRSGMGKTMLAATAPNPKIISCESGMVSLTKANQLRIFKRFVDIPVLTVNDIDGLIEAYDMVAENPDPDANGQETIILDSLTEIGEKVLAHAKQTSKDPRQAYGELIERMTEVIKKFRDLPNRHVVMVCKEKRLGNDAATMFGPMMPGQNLGEALPYLFDEVLRLGIGIAQDGTKFRYLQTQPDLQYDAKDRSGALDPVEEPNLTNVINKIKNG